VLDRVTFCCPHCRANLLAPPSLTGTRNSACPRCGKLVAEWRPAGDPPPLPATPRPTLSPAKPPGRAREAAIGFTALFALGVCTALWNWSKLETMREPGLYASDADYRDYEERRTIRRVQFFGGCVLFGAACGGFAWAVPTLRLKDALAALQPVVGKGKDDVTAALGPPPEVENLDGGRVTRATWKSPMFRFTLEFRDGKCTGLVHRADG
jgi:hypothetical protein